MQICFLLGLGKDTCLKRSFFSLRLSSRLADAPDHPAGRLSPPTPHPPTQTHSVLGHPNS